MSIENKDWDDGQKYSSREWGSNEGTGRNNWTPEEIGITPAQQLLDSQKPPEDTKIPAVSPKDYSKNHHEYILKNQVAQQKNPDAQMPWSLEKTELANAELPRLALV